MLAQIRRVTWKAVAIAAIISLFGFNLGLAASGDLDATFSGDGKVTTGFTSGWSEWGEAIALQSDGRIVVAGERWQPAEVGNSSHDFALARYNTDGSLDTSFSGDGKVVTNFGAVEYVEQVVIQSDGKIVVSGDKCNSSWICDLAVARYNSNGSLDTTFSGDGKLTVGFGSGDNGGGGGLAIRSDGKIVIGGYMINASGNADFAVYRLNPNGTLDTTFSGDGKVNGNFGPNRHDTAFDLVLQSGKILVVGRTCDIATDVCDFALVRINSDATLDATFAGDGTQTTNFGASEEAYAVARQSNGKYVVVGDKCSGTVCVIAVARYGSSGQLDATFSGDGKQTFSIGTKSSARDLVLQGDGKIVVAGSGYNGVSWDFVVARLLASGNLDTSFSGDGKVRVDFGGNRDGAYGLARQSDGKYVLAGYTYDDTPDDFALARILP